MAQTVLEACQRAPQLAPKSALHRKNVEETDAEAPETKASGMNFADHAVGMFEIVPADDADPSVEVLFWSDAAGAFMSNVPAVTGAGHGAGVPYQVTFPVNGRVVWVKVTDIGGDGSVNIYGSAFDTFPRI